MKALLLAGRGKPALVEAEDPNGTGAFLARLARNPTTSVLQYPPTDVEENQLARDLCRETIVVNDCPITAHQDLVNLSVLRRQLADNVFVARTMRMTTAEWRAAAIERMLQAGDRTVSGGDTYIEVLGLLAEHAANVVATPSGSTAPAPTTVSTRTTYLPEGGCKIDVAVVSANAFDVVRLPLAGPTVAPVAQVRSIITHRMVLTTQPPPSVASMSSYDPCCVLASDCVVRGSGERELAMKVVLTVPGHQRTSSATLLPTSAGASAAASADVLLAGHVFKLAHNRLRGTTTWKLRWIAVKAGQLYYYRHKGDVAPKEVLDLRERDIHVHDGGGALSGEEATSAGKKKAYRGEKPFRFSLGVGRTAADSKCHFAALTNEGMDLWVRCLRHAVAAPRSAASLAMAQPMLSPLTVADRVSRAVSGRWPAALQGRSAASTLGAASPGRSSPAATASSSPSPASPPRGRGSSATRSSRASSSASRTPASSGGSISSPGTRRRLASMRLNRAQRATLAAVGGKLQRALKRGSSKPPRVAGVGVGRPLEFAEDPSQRVHIFAEGEDDDEEVVVVAAVDRAAVKGGAGGGQEESEYVARTSAVPARRRANVVVGMPQGASSQPAFMRMEQVPRLPRPMSRRIVTVAKEKESVAKETAMAIAIETKVRQRRASSGVELFLSGTSEQ
tara:strand:- start:98 stop:2128 length:2031 start_codon:yes stop_codon:yes gene_type:complete